MVFWVDFGGGFIPAKAVLWQRKFRVVHRDSHNEFRCLSPRNFHAAVLFSCETLGLEQRCIYRQRTSESGRGARLQRDLSGSERDISTGLKRKGLWARAGKRGRSSEGKRKGSGTRVWARRDGQPERQRVAERLVATGRSQGRTGGRSQDRKQLGPTPSGGKGSGRRQDVSATARCEDRV